MALLDQTISTRKLAAILSADIAGYSALMSADEEGTVRRLREVREAVLPIESRPALRPVSIPGLFVTGTDTGVGKTVVAGMIADWFRRKGSRVAVLKPVATGCVKGTVAS